MATEKQAVADDDGQVRQLCRHLAGKPRVQVAQLPDDLRAPAVLARAMKAGYVEFQRQSYAEITVEVKHSKGPDGRYQYDEMRRPILEREYQNRLEGEWSAFTPDRPGRKTLPELLDEDTEAELSGNQIPPLHVRITTAGQAVV